jgi:hypothetical protein
VVREGATDTTVERNGGPLSSETSVSVDANLIDVYADPDPHTVIYFRGRPSGGYASVCLDDDAAAWLVEALSSGLARRRAQRTHREDDAIENSSDMDDDEMNL